MAYIPFKAIGSREFVALSGSGTVQAVGATTLGGTLNVTGAITLDAPASGTMAGPSSQLALDADGLVVLDSSNIRRRSPIGCYFSSSDVGDSCTTISLIPSLGSIDGIATVPITKGSTMINIDISSTITADIEAASTGASGLDDGTVYDGADGTLQGYYLFLITKDDAVDPALIFSLNPISPKMPPQHGATAAYTYKSEALFYVLRNATYDTWQRWASGTDGWTYSRYILLSNGQATATEPVDCTNLLPSGGEAWIQIRAENTDSTNRNITISANGSIVTGAAWPISQMYSIATNGAGVARKTAWQTLPVAVPVSGTLNDDETFYYSWDVAPAGSIGATIYAQWWRTTAYCR
jgi:hypothetical protein